MQLNEASLNHEKEESQDLTKLSTENLIRRLVFFEESRSLCRSLLYSTCGNFYEDAALNNKNNNFYLRNVDFVNDFCIVVHQSAKRGWRILQTAKVWFR